MKKELNNDELTFKLLIKQFDLKILSNEKYIENKIEVYGLNRAGLELAGYIDDTARTKRLVLISSKEYNYMMKFDENERKKRYEALFKSGVPGIIMTKRFKDSFLIEVSQKYKSPVLRSSNESTSDLTQLILDYMDSYFAPQIEVHGTLVNVYGKGVLICGESGIGKSEIAMELVSRNHLFVGDDRIILSRKYSHLYGKSHPILQNLIEVRGLGIMDITKIVGYKSVIERTHIDVVVNLEKFKQNGLDETDRLGTDFDMIPYLGIKVPHITIPISPGRSITLIIENAVSKLKLQLETNYENPIDMINKRIDKW